MAAAAILKNRKLTYLLRSLSDFHKIWHSDVVRPSWPFGSLKYNIVKNPRLWLPPSWKMQNGDIATTVWPIAMKFGMVTQFDTLWCVPQLELCNFKNSTWRPPLIWKIEKLPYLGHSFSDYSKIWHGDAIQPSWPFGPLQIWDGGGRHPNNLKITISRQRFDGSAQHLAWWRILALRTRRAIHANSYITC